VRLQLALATEIVSQLEAVGDQRSLASHEECLRKELNLKALGLSTLQQTIARQESCILWFRQGDVPMKFFHAHANARQCRNYIHSLDHDGRLTVLEDAKARLHSISLREFWQRHR
jgi:hypothetical protein